jgi:hypothetical protein
MFVEFLFTTEEFRMSKRFFLTLALTGMLGLASASSAQAGSIVVTADAGFSILGGTADKMTIIYNITGGTISPSTVTPIAAGGLTHAGGTLMGPTYLVVGDTVTLSFDPTTGTSPGFLPLGSLPVKFSFSITGTAISVASYTISGSNGSTALGGAGILAPASVPEPASLALLGIGMTGFLAFRRFFKKTSVA